MPSLTFFPLGNADCCLIDLSGGQKILFDFGDQHDPEDDNDLRIDLTQTLRDNLASANKDSIDVAAFTHLDLDHINLATEFFWLEHSEDYQSDERIRIGELWVPAAAIIDEECEGQAEILQAEARHRLKEGSGIRVFSFPEVLEDWLTEQGLTLADRADCIVDAGTVVPTFNRDTHGVEFFVHSPFAHRLDDAEVVERNKDSIMVQATFVVDGIETKALLGSDVPWEHLQEIIQITKDHGREERLEWDICKLPHHCSYLSLSDEKGKDKTVPVDDISWLYEKKGEKEAIIISPSWPIPSSGDDVQPPHRQAANYYNDVVKELGGEFIVTMEHPTTSKPEKLVITIDSTKARVERAKAGWAYTTSRSAPRAGS